MSPQLKKRLITAGKVLIVLMLVFWIAREIHKSWGDLVGYPWHFHFGWLALAGLAYALAYLPACAFWHLVMRGLGQSPRWVDTLRAYYIGHLGKYVPGKAVVVILRAGLVSGAKVRPSIAAAAVFFETLTMMAVGAFLSAIIVIVCFHGHRQQIPLTLTAVAMMCVAAMPLSPPVFRFLAKKLGVGRGDPEIDEKLRGINLGLLAVGWGLMSLTWIVLGICLWASIHGVGFDPGPLLDNLPRLTGAVAMAMVLGFLAMIPAGFGVREGVLVMLLTSYFTTWAVTDSDTIGSTITPEAIALVITAIQRLISIFTELIVSAVLLPKWWGSPPKADESLKNAADPGDTVDEEPAGTERERSPAP